MAFNNSFTAVTGATYTAAQYNTHVRDNMTAIWVYTTAGDIAYATGATALARLGIGANNTTVLMPASGIPSWSHSPQLQGILHAEAHVAYVTTDQTTTSTTYVDVTSATVDIVLTQTCTVIMHAIGKIANGTAGFNTMVTGLIGGVTDPATDKPFTANELYVPFSYFYRRTGVTAGTVTCKIQFRRVSSGTAYITGGKILVQAFVE